MDLSFYVAWLLPRVHQLHLQAHLHLLRLPWLPWLFVDFMDGKKRNLKPATELLRRYLSALFFHTLTGASRLETTGHDLTGPLKSAFNLPQQDLCLDLALSLLRDMTSQSCFTAL